MDSHRKNSRDGSVRRPVTIDFDFRIRGTKLPVSKRTVLEVISAMVALVTAIMWAFRK
jgi:hypothetical protein